MAARFPAEPFSPDRLPDPVEPPAGVDPIFGTILRAAVTGGDAYRTTRAAVRREGAVVRLGNRFVELEKYREIAFLAIGDAAGSQALAVHSALGQRITQGLLASRFPLPAEVPFPSRQVGGPLGTGAQTPVVSEALELARGLSEKDLLIVLLSAGAGPVLVDPPVGLSAADWRSWLASLPGHGLSGREGALLARVLGRGAAGGRLVASTPADVVTLAVDPGTGAELVGGGPTRPVSGAERTEARAILDRLGTARGLPSAARAGLEAPSGPLASGRDTAESAARVVVVAGPGDALREVGEAVSEKRWRPVLAELVLDAPPAAAGDRLAKRVEEIVAAGPPSAMAPIGGRPPRGVIAFASTTLAEPDGSDAIGSAREFLERAAAALARRDSSVALLRTGGAGPDGTLAGGVASAVAGSDGRPSIRPVPMRGGITDVGFVAAVVVPAT